MVIYRFLNTYKISSLLKKINGNNANQWAIVTGASDGIGLEFSRELVKRGFRVVMVSRTLSKLEEAKNSIQKSIQKEVYGSQIEVISADFSLDPTSGIYVDLKTKLNNLGVLDNLSLLVNNVGMSYVHADYLENLEPSRLDSLVHINLSSTIHMTRMVVEGMKNRGRGCILNIGSAAGHIKIGNPLYSGYSAVKAGIEAFSKSMHYEVRSKGVLVTCIVPYFVQTKMSKIKRTSKTVPSPSNFVKSCLNNLKNSPTNIPYFYHYLQDIIMTVLPEFFVSKYVISLNKKIMKKAYKKKQ